MHPKLQATIDSMELYQGTFPEDSCILVVDKEQVIGYKRGKNIDLNISIGTKITQLRGTVTEQALTKKRFLKEEKGPEKFGVSYVATAQPIMDGSQIIGVVSVVTSNEKVDTMRLLATDLSSSVEEMTATNMDLSVASSDVSTRLEGLVDYAETMNNDIQQINQIVLLVKDIAQKSKILGLNASIEAARSGEHGKGFAVVANEIQKMAQGSTESADQIAKQLENIRHSIHTVTATTNQIATFTEQFAAGMKELNHAYDNVNGHASKLLHISRTW